MDLVATLRVLGKHKFLVVLVLAITVGGTAGAWVNSSQTKEASGSYVLLSAPSPQPNPDGSVTVVSNNPFSDMDQSTVVDVLVRAVSTEQVASELQQAGLVGTYQVAGNLDFIRGPLFDVTATAPTTEEALAGFDLVSLAVGRTLEQRQLEAGANPDYLITMQQVSNPVVSTPGLVGRIRTSIVLLAVGVVIAVALALGVDLLQQRRRRRKAAAASVTSAAPEADPGAASAAAAPASTSAEPGSPGSDDEGVDPAARASESSEPDRADDRDDERATVVAGSEDGAASTDQGSAAEDAVPTTDEEESDEAEVDDADVSPANGVPDDGADGSSDGDDSEVEDLEASGDDPAEREQDDEDLDEDEGAVRSRAEHPDRRSPYVVATGLKAAGLKAAGLRTPASSGVERGTGH